MSSLFHILNISRQDIMSRLTDLDVVANNLANVNTPGYKAGRSNFQELVEASSKEGITLAGTQNMMGQGNLTTSDNPLDWAIQGEGFFQVQLPDGTTAYTRAGQFSLDADHNLVTASGYKLIWDGTVPDNMSDLSVSADGSVVALLEDGTSQNVGTVQLARFANPTGLVNLGNNVWGESDASGTAQVFTPSPDTDWISSHAVEQSNVDMTLEMTNLMSLQRNFQMSVKAFQQTDNMISIALRYAQGVKFLGRRPIIQVQ